MTSFAIKIQPVGAHVHVQVWAGPHEEARGLTGTLIMRPEEADDFQRRVEDPESAPARHRARMEELVGPLSVDKGPQEDPEDPYP